MQEQLNRIKSKLGQLRKSDYALEIFGASSHRYHVNSCLDESEIRTFELKNNIKLPEEYTAFLTTIGNGGAGPFYGLEPLKNVLFCDLDYKRPEFLLTPSKPFMHSKAWNMKFEPSVDEDEDEMEYQKQYEEFHDMYYDNMYMNGAIAICNYGCAVSLNLVVNGEEYGNMWTDDRASDAGIYPSRELGNNSSIKFLDWYELWIDNAMAEIATKKQNHTIVENFKEDKKENRSVVAPKPWWKFW